MELNFETINWLAVGVCIVIGQVFLTVWFTTIFGTPWAKAYGVEDKQQHTKEIPGYTYGIGFLCTALLTIGIAIFQSQLSVGSLSDGLSFGVLMVLFFSISTALPGYAFLKRYNVFFLAIGSQSVLILMISTILAIWK